ncbi:MAG: arginine--tRNA ligase [Planctomycetota bacterium]
MSQPNDTGPSSTPNASSDTGGGFDPLEMLRERFTDAIARAFPDDEGARHADPLIAAGRNPSLGDFQSNAAMPLGKKLGLKPREVAEKIVAQADLGDLAEPLSAESIAGPGFINIRLRPDALSSLLTRLNTDDLGLPAPEAPPTVVVDLCGVNLAKQMHVGHLRSTVIGDALARVFERLGANVRRQNHVGDWGLPIAMVASRLRREAAAGRLNTDALTLDDLDRLYRAAQHECSPDRQGQAIAEKYALGPKVDAELEAQIAEAEDRLAEAKRTLVALQSHDAETVALWRTIYDVTMAACLEACDRLKTRVSGDDSAGESSYAEELAGLVEDLETRGVAEASDGALVVRVEGVKEPCIIRKSDGGFLYATTDLAAIRRRVQSIGADRVVYAVDARQSLHFRQIFGAATKAGYATRTGTNAPSHLEHAAFGTVLGEDNRPFKTRSGENVKLADLLEEAVRRAGEAVAEKNPSLPDAERASIAEAIGIAAVKFADLSSDRIRDYVFSFDRMLAFEGATGPYLLYALVRTRSIFRKAAERGIAFDAHAEGGFAVAEPAERALALTLLRYPSTVRSVGESLEPHRLCQYLYDLATAFSSFFEHCPVLSAEDEAVRSARLRLCDLTARVLADGLETLGLPTIERM